MRKATCSVCGSEQPSGEMFALDGRPICAPCAEKLPAETKAAGEKLQLGRIMDPTICSVCATDHGDTQLPLIGGKPVCDSCAPGLYHRPFPLWLKAGLAVLLLLLGWSLWRSRHYFAAERHMVRGERAMDRHDYTRAANEFEQVLLILPDTQKAVLLGAKAHFMAGDPDGAVRFFSQRSHWDHADALYKEVNGMFKSSVNAVRKARRAVTLDGQGQYDEAARLMTEAAKEYPQALNLVIASQVFNSRAAFYRKDYDASLAFAQAALDKSPGDPNLNASVAAALACKYALTGDAKFHDQAEQMLAKAQTLAQASPDDRAAFEDYSVRIRYRLQSREILDKDEYDRRFPQKGVKR